jgi:hypothetical protein
MGAEVEVDFGSLSPSPGGCTLSSGDSGYVCANPQSFAAAGNTFTATGFESPFNPAGGGALTLTPLAGSPLAPPSRDFRESGLGENNSPPGTPCTNNVCEIDPPFGVAVVASGSPMDGAIISVLEESSSFNFFTGPSIASLSFFGSFQIGDTPCAGPAGTVCTISFPDAAAIGVEATGFDVILNAVSTSAVPEPSTWAMLLLGFAGLGFAGYRKARQTRALAA